MAKVWVAKASYDARLGFLPNAYPTPPASSWCSPSFPVRISLDKPAEGAPSPFPSSSLVREDIADQATPELEFRALGSTVL